MSRRCVFFWLTIAAACGTVYGIASGGQSAPMPDAQQPLAEIVGSAEKGVRLGFDGVYKVGHWTPLAVTLRSTRDEAVSCELAVEVVDGDGVATIVRKQGVTLAPGTSTVVRTLVKPGRPQAAVKVLFESPESAVDRTFAEDDIKPALLATQELFLEVGRPIGLDRLRQFYSGESLEQPAAALVKDPSELPANWLGYSSVDTLAVTTSEPDVLAKWDARRADAVERWVRLGGKLILCVGRNGAKLAARQGPAKDAGSPLSRFVPGRFNRVVERQPDPWESFAAPVTEQMPGRVPTTRLDDVQGRIELSDKLSDGDIPLVVRTPYGFGEVLFVAADLDQAPFTDWSARTKLLMRLLERANVSSNTSAARATNVQSIRLGYTDLSGQLRAALGQFAGARMVPFWPVFLLALGYAAVVFPLEFALARWLRPRFEVAWILLPLVLLASAIGIWYVAVAWKGRETLAKKVEMVDVDLASGAVRGQSWLAVYSPREDAYDLTLAPSGRGPTSMDELRLSWLGLPGGGLGGMNSQVGALAQFDRGYAFGEPGSLTGVPFAVGTSKSFEASWHVSVVSSTATLDERPSDHQPRGRFHNTTRMTLRDCMLLYNGRSYSLGTLAPGGSVEVGHKPSLLNVQSYLTQRHTVGDKEQATPYEPDGADLRRIVRAIQFHEAAGAQQYTSLSNRVYNRLDMSGLLRHGRAVLLATGPPATQVEVIGHHTASPQIEQELAYYRFVIPVDRTSSIDGPPPTVELRLD